MFLLFFFLQNAPELNDNSTQAHLDILIVNIVRGSLLRGARVWVLGRRAAVSQIPPRFIDAVTEIQGFRCAGVLCVFSFCVSVVCVL